ncbi:hypothetical protein C8Q75DRAFT_759806 [Abortiporus biennis]|nr:hypothetical protein C8Q75DRAFT_759806 [Abortiporus biennis]
MPRLHFALLFRKIKRRISYGANTQNTPPVPSEDLRYPIESSGFSLPSLPIEIILLILKHLDRTTLIPLSALCRLWRSFIRPMMFREFCLRISSKGIYTFCDFLDATPDIGPLIHSIQLTGRSSYPGEPNFPRLSSTLLLSVLSRLPVVHSLKLSEVDWALVARTPGSSIPTTIPSMKFLDLSGPFVFNTVETVGPTLAIFPNLHTINFGSSLDWLPVMGQTVSQIRNGDISSISVYRPSPAAIHQITPLFQHRQIHSVEFSVVKKKQDLTAFLREYGKQVIHLGFGLDELFSFIYGTPDAPSWDGIGFSMCTSLQSMRVSIAISHQDLRFAHHWDVLISIVGQVPVTVKMLTCKIELHSRGSDLTQQLMDMGWEELQEKLLALPNLDTFVLVLLDNNISGGSDIRKTRWETLLSGRLSQFDSERDLVFDFPS